MNNPTPLDLRTQLHQMVLADLLGPAGGLTEEMEEDTVRTRYIAEGKIGSLHAKVGVADGDHRYLSSANLTDYAMNINMEMGVLVHGNDLPPRIEEHFAELISNGTLAEIADE